MMGMGADDKREGLAMGLATSEAGGEGGASARNATGEGEDDMRA